jgi:hypothetical protein
VLHGISLYKRPLQEVLDLTKLYSFIQISLDQSLSLDMSIYNQRAGNIDIAYEMDCFFFFIDNTFYFFIDNKRSWKTELSLNGLSIRKLNFLFRQGYMASI